MAVPPDPAWRRSAKAALVLGAAGTAAFGVVAVVHDATRDRIAATEHAQALARFDEVLAGVGYDNDLLADTVKIRDRELLGATDTVQAHRARRDGQLVAVTLELITTQGYSGPIRLLLAVTPDGTVLNSRVVQHRETPGLGDFIDARKSDWIEHFRGRSLHDPAAARWRVRKDGGDFDQYTGATVTSRAMVGAVARGLALFDRHRDELLAAPATIAP